MVFPSISDYKEAIALSESFAILTYLTPEKGLFGDVYFSSGNFAVVFKMRDSRNGALKAVKNHIERQILLAGFTMERNFVNDYGFDGYIQTFRETGEIDVGGADFQLKSTDKIQFMASKQAFTFDLSIRDLQMWLRTTTPTLLILFDAQAEIAYYINLQDYFRINAETLQKVNKYIRVYLPSHQIFNKESVLDLRKMN